MFAKTTTVAALFLAASAGLAQGAAVPVPPNMVSRSYGSYHPPQHNNGTQWPPAGDHEGDDENSHDDDNNNEDQDAGWHHEDNQGGNQDNGAEWPHHGDNGNGNGNDGNDNFCGAPQVPGHDEEGEVTPEPQWPHEGSQEGDNENSDNEWNHEGNQEGEDENNDIEWQHEDNQNGDNENTEGEWPHYGGGDKVDEDEPTPTNPDAYRITHTVVAGLGGLRFEPDNVVAEKGSIVEFHFLPRNHAVAQSSFANPCQPLLDENNQEEIGFYSGFNFATEEGQANDVFQIEVTDPSTPIWYYCPQQNGMHCQSGMVGVINQNFDNQDFSLRRHRELASATNETIIPEVEQGGEVLVNPNPLSGY